MSVPAHDLERLADVLWAAESARRPVEPLTASVPGLAAADAYAIQHRNVARKLAAGARVVGRKVGLTSRAMQQLCGVDQPDYGHLLDTMQVPDGGTAEVARLLQPKIEGEIAFVLARDVAGPGVTGADVLAATARVVPALEIVDSRIRDWKITLADTIADNASSGLFVVGGPGCSPEGVDLPLVGMVVEVNGEVALTGAGAAVLGDPAVSVAWLANALAAYGDRLRAGDLVLAGSLSSAVPVAAGDRVTARFAHLGRVSVEFA